MHIPTLKMQYSTTYSQLQTALESLNSSTANLQVASGGSANWLLAHIIASRQTPILLVGGATIWDAQKLQRWGRDAAPLGANETLDFEQLKTDLATSQEALMTYLSSLSEADLARETPIGSLGGALAFLLVHEARHLGQLLSLPRLLEVSR